MLNKNTELIHKERAKAEEFQVCSIKLLWVNSGQKSSSIIKNIGKPDWWSVWGEVHTWVNYIRIKFEPGLSEVKVTNTFANVGLGKD